MEAGESFRCAVLGFTAAEIPAEDSGDGLDIEEVPVPVPLSPGSLRKELDRSIAVGDPGGDLISVFVPQAVVEEAIDLAERAGEVEVGSVLIGRMHHDAGAQELFLKITAQIPARHALSEAARLSFTAETWEAVQAAIDLRQSSEQQVGWLHTHPARHWCNKECSAEARERCFLAVPFFSRADCDFHRICHLNPGHIAMLVTNSFAGMKVTMYGWDRAIIVQRGFHIIKSDAGGPLPAVASASIIGADTHETPCHP